MKRLERMEHYVWSALLECTGIGFYRFECMRMQSDFRASYPINVLK